MCQGFGGIVTQDGRVLFCEPDKDGDCSHSELLKRLGMKDNEDKFIRRFVRFEFPAWKPGGFRWDENDTLTGWVTEEHRSKCKKLLRRCAPAYAEYQKVCAPAYAEYQKVCDAAEAAFAQKLSAITGYVAK